MSVVQLDFFRAHDINGGVVFSCTDQDPFFERLEIRPALRSLGGGTLVTNRRIGAEAFGDGAFGPEAFVRVLVPAISETEYVWGFLLNLRTQQIVSHDEKGGERFTMSGPGPLYYLDRAILWNVQFSGAGYLVEPENGVYRWTETASAGAILKRLFTENDANTIADFLPDLTHGGFDQSDDSAGNPWLVDIATDDGFELRIGDSYLQHLWKLMEADDTFDVTVDLGTVATPTLKLEAWQSFGRDLTGASFASDVVRFEEGENIEADMEATGTSMRNPSHVLIRGLDGNYHRVMKAGWTSAQYAKAVAIDYDSAHEDTLARAGNRYLRRVDDFENEIELEFSPGFLPNQGLYMPGWSTTDGHAWLGDLATLSTGGGSPTPLDYDDEAERITGFRMVLDKAAVDTGPGVAARSWHVFAQFNIEQGSDNASPRAGAAGSGAGGGAGPHSHPVKPHKHPANPRYCTCRPNATELAAAPSGGGVLQTNPRAWEYGDYTYWVYLEGTTGDAELRARNNRTGAVGSAIVLKAALNQDAHAVPSLWIRSSDRRLMVVYSADEGPQLWTRLSVNSLDTDPTLSGGFVAEVARDSQLGGTDYTYFGFRELTSGLFLIGRTDGQSGAGTPHDNQTWGYSESTDDGATLGAATTFYMEPSRGGYVIHTKTAPNRIDLAVYDGAPVHETTVGLYHGYFDGSGFYETDGTPIASLPFDSSDLTEVYNVVGHRVIAQNTVLDEHGRPCIAFMVIHADGDIRARYARWNGSSWGTIEVADNVEYGSGIKSGGVWLTTPNVMWISRHVTGDTTMEMWRSVRAADGSWSGEAVTTDSATDQTGPQAVVDAVDGPVVLWRGGDVSDDLDYSASTVGGFACAYPKAVGARGEGARGTSRCVLPGDHVHEHPYLGGPGPYHSHLGLRDVGPDDHHDRDHATRHAIGGDDPLTPAAIGAADDDHTHAGGAAPAGETHLHIVDEQFSGDGATTTFALDNEAEPESAIAYVAGARTSVTVGGSMNDEITFTVAPASGTDNVSVDYVAVAT